MKMVASCVVYNDSNLLVTVSTKSVPLNQRPVNVLDSYLVYIEDNFSSLFHAHFLGFAVRLFSL